MEIRKPGGQEWKFGFINGPNMSMLGRRGSSLYGPIASIEALNSSVDEFAASIGVSVTHCVSNFEGEILEFIHTSRETLDGYLINPAGLTYFGQATRDALIDTDKPYVEVHFANLGRWSHDTAPGRPELRSIFSHTAVAVFEGMRHYGYYAAIMSLAMALDDESFLGTPTSPAAVGAAQSAE